MSRRGVPDSPAVRAKKWNAACRAARAKPLGAGVRSGRQRDGVLEVVAYVCPDGPSPWWAARCRACKAVHEYRANRLRNYRPSCRSCGAA